MAPDESIGRRSVLKGMAAGGAAGLAGCTSITGNDDEEGGDTADGVEFTAWSFGPNFPVLEEGAATWNEDNPHTVNPEEIDGGIEPWTSALQVQQGLPGIGLIQIPAMRAAARNGGLENLNDLVKPNMDKLIDSAISATHVDGNFFSIPHSVNPVALIYNKNMFEDAGLPGNPADVFDEIQTYDDLVQAGEEMEAQADAKLLAHGATNIRPPNALFTQFEGGFYNPDGEFEFDQQANVEVMQTMKDLQPYGANLDLFGNVIWDEFRNGNVASFLVPGWYIGFIRENLSDMSGEWRLTQLPAKESGGPRGATAGGAPEAIPVAKSDEIKSVAKEFGEFRNLTETSYNQKLSGWIFPANVVDDASVLDTEVEYFGGQTVFEELGRTLEVSPPQDDAPSPEVDSMYVEAYRQIMQEDADIEATLAETNERMIEIIDEDDMTRMTVEEVRNSA